MRRGLWASFLSQASRRDSRWVSDHSCPQCLHLYAYWNSSMSMIIGFPSETAIGVTEEAAMARPDPLLPLRTTAALSTFLPGIDSLCSLSSFLLSSLMWNLRPQPGQCLKNSVRDSLPRLVVDVRYFDQRSWCSSKCFSDHSCPQCPHL